MSAEWQEVIAPDDMRVVAPDGTWVVQLAAGEVTRVHPSVFTAALAAGCSVPGGSAGQAQTDDDVIAALADVMLEVVTEGDSAKLTKNGEPRYSVLKERVAGFTEAQREAAWAQVQAAINEGGEQSE